MDKRGETLQNPLLGAAPVSATPIVRDRSLHPVIRVLVVARWPTTDWKFWKVSSFTVQKGQQESQTVAPSAVVLSLELAVM
jgi:hypothetical protein